MLSREDRILHSSYDDDRPDASSSIARSIASQRSQRSGGFGAYDARSIRPASGSGVHRSNSIGSGGHGSGSSNLNYGPTVDPFEQSLNLSPGGRSPGGGIGRRIGKAVRRLSGGHLSSSNLGKFVDLLGGSAVPDAGGGGDDNLSIDMGGDAADDTNYDDNVYGAVINDQERIMEQRRSRRNACMVCLMVGMMAAFVLVVYGLTAHTRQVAVDGISGTLGGIGGALGVAGSNNADDAANDDEEAAVNANTPTSSPTVPKDDHQIGVDIEEQSTYAAEPSDAAYTLPSPPADLAKICGPSSILTAEGLVACHNLCQPARCCFIEADGIMGRTLSCRDSRPDDCQIYEDLCSVLDEKFDGGAGSGDELAGDGEDESDDADESEDDDEDEDATPPTGLAPIPEMLPSLCSPTSLDDTYEACHGGCSKAECCYLAQGHSLSCADDEYTCAMYDQICSILDYYDPQTGNGKDITIEIPSVPSDLDETCSQESLETTAGLKACHKKCFYATCCEIDQCTVTNPGLCDQYSDLCSNLADLNVADAAPSGSDSVLVTAQVEDEMEDGTSIFIGEGTAEDIWDPARPPPPAAGFSQSTLDRVSKLCTYETLSETGGITACNIACRPAMCCFYSDDDMSIVKGGQSDENHLGGSMTATCINNKTNEWCSSYDPCQLLLHLDDEDLSDGIISAKELTEAFDQACLFPEEGEMDECEQLCKPGRCCYEDDEPCLTASIDCSLYEVCHVLASP